MITKEIRMRVEEALQIDLNGRQANGKHIRKKDYVMGRALYYGLCYNVTPMSLQKIGDTLGQDHATVLYAIKNNFDTMEIRKEHRYIKVCEEIMNDVKPIQARLKREAKEARNYLSLLDDNAVLKTQLDQALRELNNEENYIQRYIMAKTQLNYLKSAITKTNSLATAKSFIESLENVKE